MKRASFILMAMVFMLAACGNDASDDDDVAAAAPIINETTAPDDVGTEWTRDNPVQFGETAMVGEWEVRVLDVNWDATELVKEYREIEHTDLLWESPEDGIQLVIVEFEGTYHGEGSAQFGRSVYAKLLDERNVANNNRCGPYPGSGEGISDVFTGGTTNAIECWEVETEYIDSQVAYAEDQTVFGDVPQVFFALR